jgi:hypothetical protein
MAGGFSVNIDDLYQAADGVNGTIEAFDQQQVSQIGYESSWVGHQGLAGSMSSFLSGWQRGVQNLVSDSQSIARSLTNSADAYIQADEAATEYAGGIFKGTGPDPGMVP